MKNFFRKFLSLWIISVMIFGFFPIELVRAVSTEEVELNNNASFDADMSDWTPTASFLFFKNHVSEPEATYVNGGIMLQGNIQNNFRIKKNFSISDFNPEDEYDLSFDIYLFYLHGDNFAVKVWIGDKILDDFVISSLGAQHTKNARNFTISGKELPKNGNFDVYFEFHKNAPGSTFGSPHGDNDIYIDNVSLKRKITKYDVTFSGESINIPAQKVNKWKTVTKPDDPSRLGFVFSGWQKNWQNYDFSTPVTEDFTLNAIYNKNPIFESISVKRNGDTPKYVKAGETVTITLNLKESDTWKQNYNKLTYKIGDGAEKISRAFTATREEISRNITYTPVDGDNGPFIFTKLDFQDAEGADIIEFTAPYTPKPNIIVDTQAPTFDAILTQTGKVNQNFSFTLPVGTDNYEMASIAVSTLPAGLNFDANTRIISGIPTVAGTTTVTATYTDAAGNIKTQDFKIIIDVVDAEKMNNNPTIKDPIQEIFWGENFAPENSINTDDLTDNPQYSWENAPNNQQNGEQSATVIVRYADGSEDKISVTVKVKPLSEKYVPIENQQTVEINAPIDQIDIKKSIKNIDNFPVDAKFSWQTPPTLNEIGNHVRAEILIVYPDGSEEIFEVGFNVEDTQKPICGDFTHSPTTPTNGKVVVTMSNPTDVGSGLADGQNFTCEVTENWQKCSINIVDKARNSTTCESPVITNIDKIAPKITLEADNTNPTNGSVKITLTSDEPLQDIENWKRIDDKTFERIFDANEDVTVTVIDIAGNSTTEKISISNIDKTKPDGTVTGEPTEWTNQNVTLTLTTTKPVKKPDGWDEVPDSDGKKFTKTVENNFTAPEKIKLQDLVGNKADAEITYDVQKIDKETPTVTLTVEGNKNLIKEASVKINFTGNDTGGSGVKNFECSLNNGAFVPCTSEFTFDNLKEWENTISVRVTDNAGNVSDPQDITVTKDSTPPEFVDLENHKFDEDAPITPILLKTNEKSTISIKSPLPTGLNFDPTTGEITGTPTTPGLYTIEVEATDEAGNKTTKNFTITVKDDTPPKLELNWEKNISLVKGQPYVEPGVKSCQDEVDGNCENSVKISGTIDPDLIGVPQEIIYSVTDSAGKTTEFKRIITIVAGDVPEITISGNNPEKIELGSTYTDAGATAKDQEDGDISDKITVENLVKTDTLRIYDVKYNVTDSSGNNAVEKIRKVEVVDTKSPEFTENISDQKFDEKSPITPIEIKVSDLDSTLNISVENLPAGLVYNPTTGQIEGTPTEIWEKIVKIIAIDGSGNKTEKEFAITIEKVQVPAPTNSSSSSGGGSGGGGYIGGGNISQPTTPVVVSKPDVKPVNNSEEKIPEKSPIDILPTQNISPTDKTLNNQKIFKVNNRITDYICEEIVQAHNYPSLKFTDNPNNNSFHDDISALAMFRGLEKDEMNLGQTYLEYKKHGVVLNVAKFEPTRNVTRAEFVKMLVRSLSCRYTFMGTDTGFNDISGNEWHAEYIKFAVENGWVNGYSDGSFRPNAPITRAEAAKILSRSIHLSTNNQTTTNFTDVAKNSEFIPYIETLKAHGIMKWRNATTFAPNAHIPRTETSRIIYRTFFGGNN